MEKKLIGLRYTVYIIKCADGSLYTGIAKDLNKRLEAHRSGTGSKYVRAHLPFSLVYQKKYKDRSSASRRESEIKKLSVEEKKGLLKS
jgi:putative endonuclease